MLATTDQTAIDLQDVGTNHLPTLALRFQQALAENPLNIEALIGMSLIALASRQNASAAVMAKAATAAAPRVGMTWIALGQTLKADGRLGEAEAAYERALGLDFEDPLALVCLGELRFATGQPAEALAEFLKALHRQPTLSAALMGAAHALAFLGRYPEALLRYREVLQSRPQSAEAQFSIAFILAQMGKRDEAEARYRHALLLRPDFAAAWMNLGCLLREQGRPLHAEAALARAIELRPDAPAGWLNLALLKREQKRASEAEKHLCRAFSLDTDHMETLIAWCQFRLAEKDPSGAWAWLRWAEVRRPSHPEVANMRGILLHSERRFAEAVRAFQEAETLGSRAAASNRGNSLLEMGRFQQALAVHETAVSLDPESPGAVYNLALTQLRLGDWKRGWANYEARWKFREVHPIPLHFRCPRWRGQPIEGRRILLYAEQGLGDAIQFCRYAPLVAARGAHVILQVHEPVERLMHSLAAVLAGHITLARLGVEPPAFDLECPLMSLPAVFGTTVETVPWTGSYLAADPELIGEPRAQTSRENHPPRIGIAWAGNPRYKADASRSMNLRTLIPLLRTPGVQWISLQKGKAGEQLQMLPDEIGVQDVGSQDRDLADAAACIAGLDLVITTDTSIAHLAGAMGKPVWILLPYLSDWRWMQDIETTPWYPTAQLFRQSAPGDWAGLLEGVTASLNLSFL